MNDQYMFQVSREDLEWLADNLADIMVEQNIVAVEHVEALPLDYLDQLDLDQLVSSVGGITDPLGQLRQFLTDLINSATSYIVSTLQGVIDVAFNAVKTALESAFDAVKTAIENALASITSAFNTIANMLKSVVIDPLLSALQWVQENIPRLVDAISSALSTIADWIAKIPEMVHDIASEIGKRISEALAGLTDIVNSIIGTISEYIGKIPEMIQDAIRNVVEALSGIFQNLVNTVKGVLDTVTQFIAQLPEKITGFFEWIKARFEDLTKTITSVFDVVRDFLATLPEKFSSLLQWLKDQIVGLANTLTSVFNMISDFIEGLPAKISGFFDWLSERFTEVGNRLGELFNNIVDVVKDMLVKLSDIASDVAKQLAENITKALSPILDTVKNIFDTIKGYVEALPKVFEESLRKASEQVTRAIKDIVDKAIEVIRSAFESLGSMIESLTSKIQGLVDVLADVFSTVKDFLTNFPSYVQKLISDVPSWIWENLPDWAKKFLTEAPKSLERVAVALQGFVNAVLKFPEWFPTWFEEYIAKPIASAFEALRPALEAIGKYYERLIEATIEIMKDPAMWIKENIVDPAIRYAKDFIKGLLEFLDKLEDFVYEISKEFVKRAEGFIVEPVIRLFNAMFKVITTQFNKFVKGEIEVKDFIAEYFKAIIPSTLEVAGFIGGLKLIGEEINRIAGTIQYAASMALMAAGAAEGEPFKALAEILEKGAWNIVFNVPFSVAFWLASPLQIPMEYAIRFHLRNMVPVEIPTLTEIRDMIRRMMLVEKFDEKYAYLVMFAKLRGFSDQIVDMLYDLGERYVVYVTDRFGGKRKIPLSLLWDLPTRSDLVRMLQRDVFQSPMEWAEFIKVHGLNYDLGKMYYMMSFEYPSFEKLWEFFVRGISGMLWYQPPDFIKQWFAQDAQWLGAGIPVEPKRLNYDYKALFKAIPFYLKWIQKSNFSWFRKGAKLRYGDITIDIDFDWTADSWILWDISADLPGKIDARWMAKWALFDHISEKANVTRVTPGATLEPYPEKAFVDLVTGVVEDTVTSSIYMDLRPFCRLLVANGLHPAWVPITAVAEAINALSDERTLLRTGFINLFKEGFWGYVTLDKLLEGFFTASFAVEYFDPAEKRWKAGAINVPVKFLPAERRLLELRATMDRALDILRDLVKELNRAYAEHIIIEYKEYIADLKEGISKTNEWFKPLIKELTGKELELVADEPYWVAYAKVLEVYRSIYTFKRIRYWIGRIITWSLYRLAAAYVTVEDVKRVVKVFKDYGRLTDQEVELITKVADLMAGISRKEYIPTPSQLATIVEVVPEAIKYMDEVFEKRHVPPEWREIWAKYVEVKPIRDDVRSLLTAYRRAKVYEVDLGDLEKKILELAKKAGWTDRELEILALRIHVEELISETKELRRAYLPTPTMLATLSEYVVIPRELILETLRKRRVPEEWVKIWIRYIEVRPLADEGRMLATVFYKAKRYGVPLGELERTVLGILKELGFTEKELKLRELRATIEALIDQWREAQRQYIPTPSMLATISEVVPEARKLFVKVVEARRIPEEWVGIWAKYIQIKPVLDEVKKHVSIVVKMFEYFAIKKEELIKALDKVKRYGFEDEEVQLIIANAELSAGLRAYRELVGTPRELVTLAEYSPRARRIALAQVYKMIDALPTDQATKEFLKKMWEEYIRVRPVYDEVRRYITELLSDYANGVITREQLEKELEDLKAWGIDEYEKQFYLWLAEKRRARYIARQQQRLAGGYGGLPPTGL